MRKILLTCVMAIIVILAVFFGVDRYVVVSAQNKITDSPQNADCIIVLGAGVWENGTPSHVLEDRLKVAVSLYKSGAAPKIIVSGDHGQTDYDEVNVMKSFAVNRGVPSEDVFMDHAGFSTYETMYRAKEIFGVKSAIIVTQEFHIYRALYIADKFGINAEGVTADLRTYANQQYFSLREIPARVKDFFYCIFKPTPTYLGETIPISGNGNITND